VLPRRPAAICLIAWAIGSAPGARPPYRPDSPVVVGRLKGASITALAQDARGNLFATGTTASPQLRVKNAAQPTFAEARILRTSDLGATWDKLNAPPVVTSIVPDPADQRVLFGIGEQGIYKSTDAGQTWRVVRTPGTRYLAIDPADRLRVMAQPLADDGRVVRSFDGGETWSEGGMPRLPGPIATDPSGSGAAVIAGSFGAGITRDWGANFTPFAPTPSRTVSAVAFDPAHRGWIYVATAAGSQGGLFLTTDFGATWRTKPTPSLFYLRKLLIASDGTIVALGADGSYRSTDGASSWTRSDVPLDDIALGSGCRDAGVVFAKAGGIGSYAARFSVDFGATWTVPQFTELQGIAAGAACTFYVTRQIATDAFLAKLAPDGAIQWSTYLGGADADTPVQVVVDSAGSAYVAGNTASPDFPATAGDTGPGAFLTKFTPEGRIDYSVLIAGDPRTSATHLAVDSARSAYLAGRTIADAFPVTPGAAVTNRAAGSYTGFLAKFSTTGTLLAATYLGPSDQYPTGLVVDGADRPIVAVRAADSTRVVRLNSALSAFLESVDAGLAETGALAVDREGGLVIAGAVGVQASVNCRSFQPGVRPMLLTVTKLRASDWTTIYRTTEQAPCGLQVQSVTLDSSGAPVIAGRAGSGMPTARPVYGGPPGCWLSGAVAKLTGDGARVDFGSYFDTCNAAAVVPNAGALLVGAGDHVIRIPPPEPGPQIDAIANLFSGDSSAVVENSVFTLSISGFTPTSADLGLQRADLPTSLSGVEVRFDGIPAGVVQTGPGQVVVVVPRRTPKRGGDRPVPTTSVQLFYNGAPSNVVQMPAVNSRPGILEYLANPDGTQNTSDHPAAAGSTVTLFVTGIGNASGSIYSTWQIYRPGQIPQSLPVEPLPGYLPAISQVKLTIPADSPKGRLTLGLRLSVPASTTPIAESNYVSLYVN
jgi:uncharacterized protein (TIGR03437 family)